MKFLFNALIVLFAMSGCKTRNFEANVKSDWLKPDDYFLVSKEEVEQKKLFFPPGRFVNTGSSTTYTFSWTNDVFAKNNPTDVMKRIVAYSKPDRLKNDTAKVLLENAAGPGLYLAADPFSTENYGNVLMIIPIPARTQLKSVSPIYRDALADIRGNEVGLIYKFGSDMPRIKGGRETIDSAVVMRDLSKTELANVKSVTKGDCDSNKLFPGFKEGEAWLPYLQKNPQVLCNILEPSVCTRAKDPNLCSLATIDSVYWANILWGRHNAGVKPDATLEEKFLVQYDELNQLNVNKVITNFGVNPTNEVIKTLKACERFESQFYQMCIDTTLKSIVNSARENDSSIYERPLDHIVDFAKVFKMYDGAEPKSRRDLMRAISKKHCALQKFPCTQAGLVARTRFESEEALKTLKTSDPTVYGDIERNLERTKIYRHVKEQQKKLNDAIWGQSMTVWKVL